MVSDKDIQTNKDDFIDDLKDFVRFSNDVQDLDDYNQWNDDVFECLDESIVTPDKIMEQFDSLELYCRDGKIDINATMEAKVRFLEKIIDSLPNETFANVLLFVGVFLAAGYFTSKLFVPGKIFIIHGRDIDLRDQVKEYVQEITGQTPIILSEQANEGQIVIEKLHTALKESDYAIALMTNDDCGGILGGIPEFRCRQNVLLELGMFINKNRRNVTVIKDKEVEMPSDLHGLAYSTRETWKFDLKNNLKEAGYVMKHTVNGKIGGIDQTKLENYQGRSGNNGGI